MSELIRVLRSRIRALLKRRQLERDLQDELSFHLLEKQSALEASGVAVEEAQRLAQRRLGNSTALKESCRDAWLFSGFETTMRDAKYAARVLAKNPRSRRLQSSRWRSESARIRRFFRSSIR